MAKKKYYIDASIYRTIIGFDFDNMNRWLERFYTAAYINGVESVKGTEAEDAINEISKVKGIGPKRLEAIKEAMKRA